MSKTNKTFDEPVPVSDDPPVYSVPKTTSGGVAPESTTAEPRDQQFSPLIKSEVSFDEKTGDHVRRDTYAIAPGVDHVQEVIERGYLEKIATSQM